MPRDEKLRRIQKVIHGRMRSNLMSGLRDLVPAEEADDIAFGITTLIDGLWLRLGLRSDGVTREQALRQVRGYLTARLAALKVPAA